MTLDALLGRRTRLALAISGVVVVLLPGSLRSQVAAGRIAGQVIADQGGQPIPSALVRLPSGQVARADRAGTFSISGVSAGPTTVAAVGAGCRVGFTVVEVPESGDVRAIIRVPSLTEGRRSSGGGVSLSGDVLRERNYRSVYDAVRAMAPYMVSYMSGEVGGVRSLSNGSTRTFGSNEPLLIFDGIRVPNVSVATLDAFDVDDLERIEVARGPAAGWQYGLGGASGAIILTSVRAAEEGSDLASCRVDFASAGR